MDYNTLLDVSTELGYRLAMCGAETFRIEESIRRVMNAYNVPVEVFAIPNCLHVSIETAEGLPLTRMRRIGHHGNDLDAVEKYSNLSRQICAEKPDPKTVAQWLDDVEGSRRYHPFWIYLLGNFMGGCGFAVLFNGHLTDCLLGGICGIVVGLVNHYMGRLKANPFFTTITAAFLMAFVAYFTQYLGWSIYTEAIIIGALMILVPGLLFTNAMRDIIYGDTNSGINRIVQVFLTAAAIALGTGAAWTLADTLWGLYGTGSYIVSPLWIEGLSCLIGCLGFTILFNIHGNGRFLCSIGGVLTWISFRLILQFANDSILSYFVATVIAAIYSEGMARIRKYPAISYLVISIFPLVPGAGIYNAMKYAVRGNLTDFVNTGMHTLALAGVMAVGILLASTAVRLIDERINRTRNSRV